MLKKLGLKNQLHVLIVLLVVSIILSGCGAALQTKKSFYPEYYAARQLQNQDIVKLRELSTNPDPFIADSATLILGSYYLYYGDKNYARILIDKSYQSKNLDETMTIFGQLWKMESLIKDGDKGAAINIANNIKELRRNRNFMRTMQIYCNQVGINVSSEDEINSCLDMVLNGKEKFKEKIEEKADNKNIQKDLPISTDNMTYEEYLTAMGIGGAVDALEGSSTSDTEEVNVEISPEAKIYITGGDIYNEVVQGMLYAMGRFDNNYQLTPVSDFAANEEDKSSILLRINNNYNLFIGGNKSNINVDLAYLSEVASSLDILQNKSLIIILTTEEYQPYSKIVAENLKSDKKKVVVLNFESSYQSEMTNLLNGKNTGRYAIVIFGDDKAISSMIPIAKYWQINRRLQDVLLITGIQPSISVYKGQEDYFKGVHVLTASNLPSNPEYETVSADYKGFFGKEMTGKNALGYDIILYINSILNKENIKDKYLTGIIDIEAGYALRKPVLLYIGSSGITVKKEFDAQ